MSSAGCHLRSFDILPPFQKEGLDTGWRLWATWDRKGTAFCESVIMDDLFQFQTYVEPQKSSSLLHDWQRVSQSKEVEQFDAAYFDNFLSFDPPNPAEPYDNADISTIFITHLFYPGRFSSLTLTTALDEYTQQLPKRHQIPQLAAAYPSLPKKFAAVVGCQIEMEPSPQTGAPVVDVFRRDLKLDWLGIWARVRDLDKQARWPVASSIIDEQLVILTREGVLAPVLEDGAGIIDRLGNDSEGVEDFLDLPEGSLKRMYRALTPPTARSSVIALSAAGAHMSSALARQEGEDGGTCLEMFTGQLNHSLAAPASQPVETLAGSFWDDMVDPCLSEDDRTAIRRLLSECPNIMRGLTESLDILADLSFPFEGSTFTNLSISGLGNALLTSAVLSIITSRYSLARHILLVSLFYLADTADDEAEELIETLARAMATYHRYRILKWVTEQTGEESQTRSKAKRTSKRKINGGDATLAEGIGGLKMREKEQDGLDGDGYEIGYSLTHSLLARRTPQVVKQNSVNAVLEAATGLLSSIGLISKDQIDIEPHETDVKLVYTVLLDGHASVAGQLTELYPLSSGMAFVRGRAYLEVGDVDAAVRNLQHAAAGCEGMHPHYSVP